MKKKIYQIKKNIKNLKKKMKRKKIILSNILY